MSADNDVAKADLKRFYWLLIDVPRRWAEVEVEEQEGGHESVFDAIDACMARNLGDSDNG